MALKDNSTLPIYRRPLPKEPKPKVKQDLYEFTDVTPKSKKREHRSSIIFDKNTYEIMQKLEEKEVKEKKKKKRMVKPKKVKEIKTYDNVIDNIMKNVKDKILRRKSNDSIHFHNKENENENNGILHAGKSEVEVHYPTSCHLTTNPTKVPQSPKALHETLRSNEESCKSLLENQTPNDPILFDISNQFGFGEEMKETNPTGQNKLHDKNHINIISDVIIKPQKQDVGSPRNFVTKRPNANSTMILTSQQNVQPKPWRVDLNPVKHSPLFLSIKNNALPRLDQDVVMDHTIVEDFEKSISTKKPEETKKQSTPVKKMHQTSMLDFIESNIDKENELQLSLFDEETFNITEKNSSKVHRSIMKHVLGDATSTPVQRRVLSNIENLQDIQLEESTEISISIWKTPDRVHKQSIIANQTYEELSDKPIRFDVTKLRSYIRKKRVMFQNTADEKEEESKEPETNAEERIPTEKLSNDNSDVEVHLFEESEDIPDIPAIDISLKKPRRKRLASCDSDTSNHARKKVKKTKVDPEQEHWAADFNQMCEEVEKYELEVE